MPRLSIQPVASVDAMTLRLDVRPSDWPSALQEITGPQLVVGGPGTGKTEFLARRAVEAARRTGEQVLVLTFDRGAVQDMRRRIFEASGHRVTGITVATFHSFAWQTLSTHLAEPPSILTTPEQLAIVRDLLSSEDRSRWSPAHRHLLDSPSFAEDVADFLLRCSERRIDAEALSRRAAGRWDWDALPGFYVRYVDHLENKGRFDYGMLISSALEHLETAARYGFILVDEFQDISPIQLELCDRLSPPRRNITVAGDPNQSIYRFRGSDPTGLAEFEERFGPGFREIRLIQSFRVPEQILTTVFSALPRPTDQDIPAPHHGKLEAHLFDRETEELDWIASELRRVHSEEGIDYRDMAILTRYRSLGLDELALALNRYEVPHSMPNRRLVEHPAISWIFDLALAAASQREEADRAVLRLLSGPLIEAGIVEMRELLRTRVELSQEWPEALKTRLGTRGDDIALLLADPTWASLPAYEAFWHVWERLGILDSWAVDPNRRAERGVWRSFAQALERQYQRDPNVSLLDYWKMLRYDDFEATPLLDFDDPTEDRLVLETIHTAKGRQFEVVFIAGAIEGKYPDLRRRASLLNIEAITSQGAGGLNEEERLWYMAATRARTRLVVTASSGRPTRFIPTHFWTEPDEPVPLTVAQARGLLKRIASDPEHPAPRRLAAVSVLAKPPDNLWDANELYGIRPKGPDTGLLDPLTQLTPSDAEAYETCPRLFALTRRLAIGSSSSPWASFGRLIHRTLELAERDAMRHGLPHAAVDDALAHLDGTWPEFCDLSDAAWRRKAVETIERVYEEWPVDSGPALGLEYSLELNLNGRLWRGRADRIETTEDGFIRIVDYKTSTRVPSRDEAASSLQLGFYFLAATEDPYLRSFELPFRAEAWYPRARVKDWIRTFDEAQIEDVRQRLIRIADAIALERWEPLAGAGCPRCPVKSVCPIWPEGREAFSR